MTPHPSLDTCAHCGRRLSPESVRLALEDIGEEYIPAGTRLYCPRYQPEQQTCAEDSADASLPAYWQFT
jgi:hypothetical protein